MPKYAVSYYFARGAPHPIVDHDDLLIKLIPYIERAGVEHPQSNGRPEYLNIELDVEDRITALVICESALEAATVPVPGWPTSADVTAATVTAKRLD